MEGRDSGGWGGMSVQGPPEGQCWEMFGFHHTGGRGSPLRAPGPDQIFKGLNPGLPSPLFLTAPSWGAKR